MQVYPQGPYLYTHIQIPLSIFASLIGSDLYNYVYTHISDAAAASSASVGVGVFTWLQPYM